jgi:predicted TIM-barrel fold metal-dependent hydrolase
MQLDLNGGPDLPADAARAADKVTSLRIVINHCANLKIDGQAPPADWLSGMKAAAGHENVWCKVSALVESAGRGGNPAPKDVDYYCPVLDALWSIFGEDRLIYGSNWPVSERFGNYETVFSIAATYFRGKSEVAAEKFFAGNATVAYKWQKRSS